jgi:hypothetical protein
LESVTYVLLQMCYLCLEVFPSAISYTELALSTFLVAESRRDVSVGELFAKAIKRDGGQCAFRPSEGGSPEA